MKKVILLYEIFLKDYMLFVYLWTIQIIFQIIYGRRVIIPKTFHEFPFIYKDLHTYKTITRT